MTRTHQEMLPLLMNAKYAVGVITPAGAGTYGEVVEGMRRGNMAAPSDDQVVVVVPYYTHDLDATSIKMGVRKALREGVQAIVTVGARSGWIAKQILEEEAPYMPLICVLVGDPVKTGLIPQHNDPSHNMVALNTDPWDADTVISFMRTTLPFARKVVMPLPEGPSLWLDMFEKPMFKALDKYDFYLNIVQEEDIYDQYREVEKAIGENDVLFVPEGNLILDMHRALGALCDRNEKPFFACLDWAVRNTAALGYATSYMPIGKRAMEFARRIIFENVTAYEIPFEAFADDRHPMINATIARAQGLDSDELERRVAEVENVEVCRLRLT